MVVTATTLLLKWYAQVHDWASKGTSLGDRARLSSWLFSLLRCKMSLILPKRLYGITTREQDSSRLPSLSTVRRDTQGPTIVRGRVTGVGLECLGVVSRCLEGAPYHHYGLARIGNSEVFFVSLSLLSFCFVIIIKYSRAQEGNKHHTPIIIPFCCSRA